jgi:hypothetical protein
MRNPLKQWFSNSPQSNDDLFAVTNDIRLYFDLVKISFLNNLV